MAIKRVMGTETEYGIIGGTASAVLNNYAGKRKGHENKSETNNSIVAGMIDKGHFGGDYADQEYDEEIASSIGLVKPNAITGRKLSSYSPYRGYGYRGRDYGFSSYFGRDDMLENGARFYIDMGHPEYSTPECSNPLSAVIADKAGERILEAASKKGKISRIFKNNVDNEFNAYGTHENYLVDRKKVKDFFKLADFIRPFFVSRIAFIGSGKIGFRDGEKSTEVQKTMSEILKKYNSLGYLAKGDINELYSAVRTGLEQVLGKLSEDELIFQISQRADFFNELIGLQTTHNRPIVNTRDEPLSDKDKYMRLHVICGDANMSEVADYLKLGTTSLVLDLYEDEKLERIKLKDAVKAFHDIAKDPLFKTRVKVKRLGEMTAIDIQKMYQEGADSAYRGRDSMTDDILDRWKFVLNTLEQDPMKLDRQIDWVIKKKVIDAYRNKTCKKLGDVAVRNIDLQYHEVNRENGLFYLLQNRGLVDRLLTDEQIEHAIDNPPEDTRAWIRGEIIRRNDVSSSDWDEVSIKGQRDDISLKDPLKGTKAELYDLFQNSKNNGQLMQGLREKGYVKENKPIILAKKYIQTRPVQTNQLNKSVGGKNVKRNGTIPKPTKYPGTEPLGRSLFNEE